MKSILTFNIEDEKFAIPCKNVIKALNVVSVTSLPNISEKVKGIINFHGEIAVVVDIRAILKLPAKEIDLNDKMILTRTNKRLLAFIVNSIGEMVEFDESKYVNVKEFIFNSDIYEGTIKAEQGLIMIYDVNKFLRLEDEEALENAIG